MDPKYVTESLTIPVKSKNLINPNQKISICYDCGSYVTLKRREDNAFEGFCCGSQIVVLPSKRNRFIPGY